LSYRRKFWLCTAFGSAVLLVIGLAACARDPDPEPSTATPIPPPTATATPTFTPLPTTTLTPSWTPRPTEPPNPSLTPWPFDPFMAPTSDRDPLTVAPPLNLNTILPWDRSRVVTVLLMGIDRRPSQNGRARTDTMLVMRLDPTTRSAGMLSVPRDLWVDIPGRGRARVNSAYFYGGGELAKLTIASNLGVQVDYYLVIDFVAFTTLVDEIGGIDVDVPYPINDPTYPDDYYGYDPFYMAAGPQHMDGSTALKYARTRHGTSDFERNQRQQQVLLALRDKATNPDTLFHLLTRSAGLHTILFESFDTDLPLDRLVSLSMMVNEVPRENIRSGAIDKSYVTPATTRTGAQVLVPNYPRIQVLIAETLP